MSGNAKRISFGRPMVGDLEKQAVCEALDRKQLTNAGLVKQFEERFQEFTGGQAVAVSSCTAALHIAAMIHFKPGDEVIIPALTHVSTAHAVEAVGAIPVFADVEPHDGNISIRTITERLTPKTKGIVVVHYLGKPPDMRAINVLAREHDLKIVEDCALALGAFQHAHVGLLGDVGCFSFYPAKHITTGEGGMLLTRNPETADRARLHRHFGQAERHGDVTHFGLNYRMTEMQAAMGIVQLGRLPGFLAKRTQNYEFLMQNLPGKIVDSHRGAHYGFTLYLPTELNQKEVLHSLLQRRIEASVYYPKPLTSLSFYKKHYFPCPNAERISCQSICLPVGPHLSQAHMIYMLQSLKEILSPSLAALAS